MKFGLIAGFVSLIIGIALGAIGFSNHGLDQLKEATKPQIIHQSFEHIENIDINLWGRQVIIEPNSPDEQVHVTYNQTKYDNYPLTITGNDKTLSIKQNEPETFFAASPLTIIGEELNRSMDQDTITIQVPEKMTINQLNNDIAPGYQLVISDVTIKELTGNTGLSLDNVTVEKGKISGDMWQFYASQSHLKNLTISDSTVIRMDFFDTVLEDVKLTGRTGNSTIYGDNITILGEVNLNLLDGRAELKLSDKSQSTTSFDIQLEKAPEQEINDYVEEYYDEDGELIYDNDPYSGYSPYDDRENKVSVSESLARNAETTDDLTFKKSVKDAKGQLTIKGKGFSQVIVE